MQQKFKKISENGLKVLICQYSSCIIDKVLITKGVLRPGVGTRTKGFEAEGCDTPGCIATTVVTGISVELVHL